jgi:hypothetical protein
MSKLHEKAVWLERSRSAHGHGGPGWELGTCLWSPSTDRAGRDRYRIMREPRADDMVVHCVDSIILGESVVASPYVLCQEEPPSAAPWEGLAPYYRIALRGYRAVGVPCLLSKLMRDNAQTILRDLRDNAPDHYPFFLAASGALHPVQGAYLTRCSPQLFDLIQRCCRPDPVSKGPERV